MDKIKIDNFILENKNIEFPFWRALSNTECSNIKKEIIKKLRLPSSVSGLDLMKTINQRGKLKTWLDVDANSFENERIVLINNLPLTNNPLIYINWYRMDHIDQMHLKDFINYYEYIWYPSAEDIHIIDSNISWIFSISHSGAIQLVELEPRKN
ncbi:hypothetical protein [Leptospira noguchii]|uniref:hypothetical protein n=1 Tax=Leptospira noguchii TaxID=28182 RepID=UPI001FB803B3|nr:hypothetical protein [Leptospira noguchii]UOG32768.1 hypothetical protein MAL06_20690 [Leptospira noguchii]